MRDKGSVQGLQACINDLIGLMALPALWSGCEVKVILGILLDAMMRMLYLDFAYVRLSLPNAALVELARIADRSDAGGHLPEFRRMLMSWPVNEDSAAMATLPNPFALGSVTVLRAWPCPDREGGTVVVGSTRDGFPTDVEQLLFRTAVNQAIIELQRSEVSAARKRAIDVEKAKDQLLTENTLLRQQLVSEDGFGEIIGQSRALEQVLFQVTQVAVTKACVLIQGETGTGKELIARAVHRNSSRRRNVFVKLNCAAIPTGLLEAELFGHEKGAFTGAVGQRIGRFELADQGTIFLDEIGEIPLDLQAKLLRVLQEHEFERLGSSKTIRVDVRLVAATNRDLAQLVDQGRFRADLFYRLNVFPISVPPLRQRPEDIPLLVKHFIQRFAKEYGKTITTVTETTMAMLCRYHWYGNIRELSNVIERGVILSQGTILEIPPIEEKAEFNRTIPELNLKDFEREHILRALNESGWVIAGPSGAAARLGMKRTSLQYKMHQLNIVRPPKTI